MLLFSFAHRLSVKHYFSSPRQLRALLGASAARGSARQAGEHQRRHRAEHQQRQNRDRETLERAEAAQRTEVGAELVDALRLAVVPLVERRRRRRQRKRPREQGGGSRRGPRRR